MGSPLGPVLANVFMANLETSALSGYPGVLPTVYRRYVDDTFLVFSAKDDVQPFFDFMNSVHPNIRFTKEEESNNKLTRAGLNIWTQRRKCSSLG